MDIKEKEPFTDNKMDEYASNGTYYFNKGSLVKKYFDLLIEKDLNVNGEYYVSMVYKLMVEDNLDVSIFGGNNTNILTQLGMGYSGTSIYPNVILATEVQVQNIQSAIHLTYSE